MRKNVGGTERSVRLLLGGLLVVAGAAGYAGSIRLAFGPFPQTLNSVLLLVLGAFLIVTGVTQKCGCNRLLGIDTYSD